MLLFNYVFVKSNSYLNLTKYQSGNKMFDLKDSQKPFVRHLTTTFLLLFRSKLAHYLIRTGQKFGA